VKAPAAAAPSGSGVAVLRRAKAARISSTSAGFEIGSAVGYAWLLESPDPER
jgi:hypothetical protein